MNMMNLFESFDPSTSSNFSLNWINLMLIIFMFPNTFWILPNRYNIIIMMFTIHMYKEFKNLIMFKYKMNIIVFFNLLMMILLMNLSSLFPYIFTLPSHLSLNLIMSMPLWFSFTFYMIKFMPMIFLAHFVPLSTPILLMNFMVLIEFISNMIRPWTLSIRLTANMMAGHLLLSLMGTFISKFIDLMFFSLLIQNMLFILEISVAMIQAYVFSTLLILYFSESNK